jgi:hypothetical protein
MITMANRGDNPGRRILIALMALALRAAPLAAQSVSSQEVADAVEKGKAHLKGGVVNTPAPIRGDRPGMQGSGVVTLGVLALLNANVPPDDPSVAQIIPDIADMENSVTYLVALKCQVLAAAGPAKYAKPLQGAATWLAQAQLDNGAWTYGGGGGRGLGDHSNTQYALQGLHEAAKAGAKVPREVWARAAKHFQNTQISDGGWGYTENDRRSYGSMTVAGLASLYICGESLEAGGPKRFENGAYPDCGRYSQNDAIVRGLAWMERNFSARENPGMKAWLYYYLYGMERVGMISGIRAFGAHDWYREGARYLVGAQKPSGSWGLDYDTAFAILFLAKGNRPVLMQKLEWQASVNRSNRNRLEWNRNRHDVENLLQFIGEKFGKPTTWQTTKLSLPLTELRQAPILYVTGHDFPNFNDAETEKLRQFVQAGGTILFEACCGSKDYQAACRQFARRLYPEYEMRPLPGGHPVFNSHFNLADTYDLEGIEVGCRVGVFFSPRALACLWEMKDYADSAGRKWSEDALRLGTNIAAYATGKEMLPDRLDKVDLAETPKIATTQPLEAPRGAVRLARLIHDGDCTADARCLERLCQELRDKAKVAVVASARHMQPTDEKIAQYPVLFMNGHAHFRYSPQQIKALRTHLDRGGFLLAEACCGRDAFDKSFREMVKQLYPEADVALGPAPADGNEPRRAAASRPAASALCPLPDDHPLYAGGVGLPLGELRYRKALVDELKARGTSRPPLEAVCVDADGKPAAGGRTVILYSPYDWSCAFEGDQPFSCRGYLDEDGMRLGLNLALFAIGY